MKKLIGALLLGLVLLCGCSQKKVNKSIAVFVPGIMDDSPIYATLVKGITQAVEAYNAEGDEKVDLFVMEAGTNQAEWGPKLTGLTAEQKYDVIISSNPSIPDLVAPILKQFPKQKYILLDATCAGNQNIHTVCYNQAEQAYLTGYIAGLMSKTHKLALIAAQEYPVMNNTILPFYTKGAQDANGASTVDFRIVGNWYDATKGAELADAVYKNGVDVILPICGGASQGVISSAVNNGIYIAWFDDNGFAKAPGTVISSTYMEQAKMASQVTLQFLKGETPWGEAKSVGIVDGFVDFLQDDPNYISTVPAEYRTVMADILAKIRNKELVIE